MVICDNCEKRRTPETETLPWLEVEASGEVRFSRRGGSRFEDGRIFCEEACLVEFIREDLGR